MYNKEQHNGFAGFEQLAKTQVILLMICLLSACVVMLDGKSGISLDSADGKGTILTLDPVSIDGVTEIEFHGPIQLHVRHTDLPYIQVASQQPTSEVATASMVRDGERLLVTANSLIVIEIGASHLNALSMLPLKTNPLATEPAPQSKVKILVQHQQRFRIDHLKASDIRIDIANHGRFVTDDVVADRFRVSMIDHSRLKVANLDAGNLNIKLKNHSDAEIVGKTAVQKISLEGFGHFAASELESQRAEVSMRGYAAGRLWVHKDVVVVTANEEAASATMEGLRNRGEATIRQG